MCIVTVAVSQPFARVLALFFSACLSVSYGIWNPNEFGKVPLTDFSTPHHSIEWLFRALDQRGILNVDGVVRWQRDSEIPTHAAEVGDKAVIVFSRRILSNRIAAQLISLTETNATDLEIPPDLAVQQIRAVAARGSDLFILIYKPRLFQTFLRKAHFDGTRGLTFSPPVLMDDGVAQVSVSPSPKILFSGDFVYAVGGAGIGVIANSLDPSTLRITALPNGSSFYDAVDAGNRLIGLALEGVTFADKGGCTNCSPGFMLWDLKTNTRIPTDGDFTTPTWLRSDGGITYLEFARPTPESVSAWVRREALDALGSGTLYLGMGNADTFLGWAGVDIMFTRLDLLAPQSIASAIPHWKPLLNEFRDRLDLEVLLVDAILDDPAAALAAPRQSLSGNDPIVLAVMTSRILRALQRYQEELPNPLPLRNFAKLTKMVEDLDGHIEELIPAGTGILTNAPYLRWKYGVPFGYDGVNLPFNMQHEWAEAMFSSTRSERRQDAELMVRYFLDREGILSRNEISSWSWHYWWGNAYNGWTAAQNISSNQPSFSGYRNAGSVGYRSIDSAVALHLNKLQNNTLLPTNTVDFFLKQLELGTLYPPVAAFLPALPRFKPQLLISYSRGGSAEDFKHLVWTFAITLQEPGQPAWPAESDGDGLLDIEERMLGTDSSSPSKAAEFLSIDRQADMLTLDWQAANGAVLELQTASPDELNWQRVELILGDGTTRRELIPLSKEGSKLFRLKFLGVAVI